jgi:hypothetical protein
METGSPQNGNFHRAGNNVSTMLDLRAFGFDCDVGVDGIIEASWAGGKRLLFLFAENHRDREMKRFNILNAYALIDAGVVGCAGTEVPMADLDTQAADFVQGQSRRLFDEHRTDAEVIRFLDRAQPWWYGIFEFGSTLQILRPTLSVRCVEDPMLRERMNRISLAYTLVEYGAGPHPSPAHPRMIDHPLNLERERAMIRHVLTHWDSTSPPLAGILNTGSGHTERIASSLQEMGINYIYISIPVGPPPF